MRAPGLACLRANEGMAMIQMHGMLLLAAFGTAGCFAAAWNETLPEGRDPVLRVDTNLVLVPVTVTDSQGRLVPNLRPTDFVLSENAIPQELVGFSRDNAPMSIAIVLDLSGSMANKIGKARAAVHEFLNNLEPDDEACLVTFADRPELRSRFSSDTSIIQTALWAASPRGSTALFDALDLGVGQMRNARNERKVVLVISDGGDNHSRTTERELRRLVEEKDVQIHAIGIHDAPSSRDEMRGPWVLEDLASMSGGQHLMVHGVTELPEVIARLSLSLHDRYLLAYRPAPLGPTGKFRRIQVKIRQPNGARRLFVYARRGYRMP
jgi:Ca-activated chloride channel homolog